MATTVDEMQNLLRDIEREESGAKSAKSRSPLTEATDPDSLKALLSDIDEEEAAQPKQTATDRNRGTGIVTTPIEKPEVSARARFSAAATDARFRTPLDEARTPEIPEVVVRAANAGVDYDKPAPRGHALASLALGDKERRRAYELKLSEHFRQPIRVEVGPATGALEYLNPETNRFTLVEPPDQGMMNDLAGAAGGALVMVPELAGGALAALATKSPFATNLGGSAGAVIGEASRVYLGQAFGINPDATEADILASAGIAGGQSLAGGLVADKALQLVQFMRNAFAGNAVGFAGKHGDRLGVSLEEAAKIQDQINAAIAAERLRIGARNEGLPEHLQTAQPGDEKFALTLGESSGDAELLLQQDAIKRSPTFQAQFGEFDQERQQALVNFYDVLNQPFERSVLGQNQTVERVQEIGKTRLEYEQRRATEHLARYEADAANAVAGVQTMPLHQMGDVSRNVGDAELAAFDGRANALATNIRDVAGNARFVVNTELSKAFSELDARARNIFIGALRRDTKKKQMIPPKTVEGPEGEAVLNPVFDPAQKWTFAQSWDTLSRIKQLIRDGDGSDMDIGALKKMAGAIEKDLYDSATAVPGLGEAYRAFTGWYRREKTRLDQGTVGRILQREGGPGGRFTLASEQVFREVFPATSARGGGGITATGEFMDLIKNDPQAITAFRQAIADDWRNFVVVDGRANPARHEEWMRMHRQQLGLRFGGLADEERRALSVFGITEPRNAGEALFTPAELRSINTAAGFERALEAREAASKVALEAVNKRFDAKLANLDNPGQLLQLVRKDLDGDAARDLMKTLEKTPDVRRGFRAAYLRDMRERVMTGRNPLTQESVLNPRALRTFLYGKADDADRGQIQVLRELYGAEYVKGMETLEKALTMTAREAPFPNRSNTGFWWNVGVRLAQAKFGVISKPARIATAVSRINAAAAERTMAKAILNPGDMKELMSIWNADIRSRKAVTVLAKLGIGPGDLTPQDE
ncbi:MAG: hypothetical protein AB7Q01_15030 [Gammaproteobacteria bacterium]